MFGHYLKSKIHRATITSTNLNYEGSIEIDQELLTTAKIGHYEKVQVLNLSNGNRFETYAIPAPTGSGKIALAGPAARLGQVNDLVIIISYAILNVDETDGYKPVVVLLDHDNRIISSK